MSDKLEAKKIEFQNWLRIIVAELSDKSVAEIDLTTPFLMQGVRSKKTFLLAQLISEKIKRKVSPTIFFEYPTIFLLSQYLFFETTEKPFGDASFAVERENTMEPMAIIGMACRAPGANNLEEFWELLKDGKNTIMPIPTHRWDHRDYYNNNPEAPGKIVAEKAGFIEGVNEFDSHLFKISTAELLEVDPQQRILLELAWEALEMACYSPLNEETKNTGIFIGIHNNDYLRANLNQTQKISPYTIPGGAFSVAAGRVAYEFGFHGPSLALDTACSSSLMAIHLACQSLQLNECKMALAGGVNLFFSPDFLMGLTKSRILSPTSQCHTFDESADGYVRSEGAGLVVIKTLKQALQDQDPILAVIRGTAANQNGFSNGLLAPNKSAQISVIKQALQKAGVKPIDVDYVEAHGSGTVLGDLIELEALKEVFGKDKKENDGNLFIGSVKTNIGHTETAAGILGLIKTILAMKKNMLPAHIGVEKLNPHIDWEKSGLAVVNELKPWAKKINSSRLAGVSSFGFSGSNVHLVLEAVEPISSKESLCSIAALDSYVLILSAAHVESLKKLASRYSNYLKIHPEIDLMDFCYTQTNFRQKLEFEWVIQALSREELLKELKKVEYINFEQQDGSRKENILPLLSGKKIHIPTYPFERGIYWKEFNKPLSIAEDSSIKAESNHEMVLADLEIYIRKKLVILLQVDEEKIGNNRSLYHYGFDSLMALSLKNQLKMDLDIELPMEALLKVNDISELNMLIKNSIKQQKRSASDYIEPASHEKIEYDLSFSQQQLFFLQQLDLKNPAYILPVSLKLSGIVNANALDYAINCLAKRHDILRSKLSFDQAVPKQRFNAFQNISLSIVDLSNASDESFLQDAIDLSKKLSSQPFDLFNEFLWRVHWIHGKGNLSILLLTFHHLIMDGWSLLEIFIPELLKFYQSYIDNKVEKMSPLEIQYADYIHWQGNTHTKNRQKESLHYWYNMLQDASFQSLLGTDYPRQENQSAKGKRRSFSFSKEESKNIIQYAEDKNETLFIVLFSALVLTLCRWSNVDDIVIGTTFSTRTNAQLNSVIGDFTNHLPIRIRVDKNKKISDFLTLVKKIIMEAFEQVVCPFQAIVDKINPPRIGSRNPLYNISCVMQSFSTLKGDLNFGREAKGEFITPTGQVDNGTSEIDLIIELVPHKDSIFIESEFDIEIFDEKTIESLIQDYKNIAINMISENCIVEELGNHVFYAAKKTRESQVKDNLPRLSALFDQTAARYPKRIALKFEEREMTYEELRAFSNKLSHELRKLGVKEGDAIAIYTERNFYSIVALLSVLKAGGCYIFLDSRYPQSHIENILADANIKHVIVEENLENILFQRDCQIIELDWLLDESHLMLEAPEICTSFSDVAYIIFTSGSTGRPKGISVTHHNVARLITTSLELFQFSCEDVWTLFHSLAFDFSVWEIWAPLLTGAKIVILPFMMTRNPAELYQTLLKERVTVFNQTPSAFYQFLQYYEDAVASFQHCLRYIIFGGEALNLGRLKSWTHREGYSSPELINMYGITEITVHATFKKIQEPKGKEFHCNIGSPLPDLNMYICDSKQRLLPQGAVGEIYITGDGVAKGYVKNPSGDQLRFLSGLSGITENRVYRTGDLGRELPNKEFQYLGRIDQQIKFHGYRIELEHIRCLLNRSVYVKDSYVAVEQQSGGQQQLVAYVVPNRKALSQALLREERLEQWRNVFNAVYSEPSQIMAVDFNYLGWNDSYAATQIQKDHMQEWLQSTLDDVIALKPKNVLELGCGMGMLLFNITPHVNSYTALDLSERSIEYIKSHLSFLGKDAEKVTLFNQEANCFDHLVKGKYDVIILNSVIQFFPTSDYLSEVITRAFEYLSEDGYLYIGDVRSFSDRQLFYSEVAAKKVPDGDQAEDLYLLLERAETEEKELLFSPQFFTELSSKLPRFSQLRMSYRRGSFLNEMTKYRYNVLFRADKKISKDTSSENIIDWRAGMTYQDIEKYLEDVSPSSVIFKKIPNARLTLDRKLYNARISRKLLEPEKQGIGTMDWCEGLLPEGIIESAKKYNYIVNLSPVLSGTLSYLDCYLRKDDLFSGEMAVMPFAVQDLCFSAEVSNHVSGPEVLRSLLYFLKPFLFECLPEYMVPGHYVVLNTLPMTVNGKLDQKMLACLRSFSSVASYAHVKPRNSLEELLVSMLEELVGRQGISLHAKFFDIGGNSIIAMQWVARMRAILGLDFPLAKLFTNPTIDTIAMEVMDLLAIGVAVMDA
jgi:amino acid adenylation domain-containing protein